MTQSTFLSSKTLLLVWSFLAVTLVACEGRKVSRMQHEEANAFISDEMELTTEDQGIHQRLTSAFSEQTESINQAIAQARSLLESSRSGSPQAQPRSDSVVKQLLKFIREFEPLILNTTLLQNTKYTSHQIFRNALGRFNDLIESLYELDINSLKRDGILNRYADAVMNNCGTHLSSCATAKPFTDFQSQKILVLAARLKSDQIMESRRERRRIQDMMKSADDRKQPGNCLITVNSQNMTCAEALDVISKKYFEEVAYTFRILLLASDLSNGQAFSYRDILYVRLSKDYEEYLDSLTDASLRHRLMRAHHNNMPNILRQIRMSKSRTSRSHYCDFVLTENPLNQRRDEMSPLAASIWSQMTIEFLSCADEKRMTDRLITETLSKSKKEQLDKWEEVKNAPELKREVLHLGYEFALNNVFSDPQYAFNMGIERKSRSDLFFYIVEQVFYEQIDATTRDALIERALSQIRGKENELIEFVRNYARVQAAYLIRGSVHYLSHAIQDSHKKRNGISPSFYEDVTMAVNGRYVFEWQVLKRRFKALDELITVALGRNVNLVGAGMTEEMSKLRENFQRLSYELTQFEEHMHIAILGPMKMALAYYLSKAKGALTYPIPYLSLSNKPSINFASELGEFLVPMNAYRHTESATGTGHEGWFDLQYFRFGQDFYRTVDIVRRLHQMEMALRIGIFDIIPFDLEKEENVPPDLTGRAKAEFLFFRQATKDLIKWQEKTLIDRNRDLEDRLNTNLIDRVLPNLCQDPLGLQISYDIGDLYSGFDLAKSNLFSDINKFYDADLLRGTWDRNRFDNLKKYKRLLSEFWNNTHAEHRVSREVLPVREVILRAIDQELGNSDLLIGKTVDLVNKFDTKFARQDSQCSVRWFNAERLRKKYLIKEMHEFYRDLHAAMYLLRINEANKLNSDVKFADLVTAVSTQKADDLNNPQPFGHSASAQDVYRRIEHILQVIEQFHVDGSGALLPSLRSLAVSATPNAVKGNLDEVINDIFGVHNINYSSFERQTPQLGQHLPLNPIGFFIDVTPTIFKGRTSLSSDLVKRLNLISAKSLTHSTWDTLSIIANKMHTITAPSHEVDHYLGTRYHNQAGSVQLFPNAKVQFESLSALEANTRYKEPKRETINFDQNPDRFVKLAMTGAFGENDKFVGAWLNHKYKYTDFDPLSKRLGWLFQASFMESLPRVKEDQINCPKDVWGKVVAVRDWMGKAIHPDSEKYPNCQAVKVTAEMLAREFVHMTQLHHILDDEKDLLRWSSRTQFMGQASAVSADFGYLKETSTAKWGYFDKLYKENVTEGVLRSDKTKAHVYLQFREALRKTDGNPIHLFSLNWRNSQIERDYLREKILDGLNTGLSLKTAIDKLEVEAMKSDGDIQIQDIRFEWSNTERSDEVLEADPSFAQKGGWRILRFPVYQDDSRIERKRLLLENGAYQWFIQDLRRYVITDAQCDFLPRPTDPDWKLHTGLNFSISQTNACRDEDVDKWLNSLLNRRTQSEVDLAP